MVYLIRFSSGWCPRVHVNTLRHHFDKASICFINIIYEIKQILTKSRSKTIGFNSSHAIVPHSEVSHWLTREFIHYRKTLFTTLIFQSGD